MSVLDWLFDSDPAIRWQVLRDLLHAPSEIVGAERARTATEGWGAKLLALQGEGGQWAGGACFPAHSLNWRDENQGQPWTSTLPTLQLLRDFGVDPNSERVRYAVELVKHHCRWEHAGQPFFAGEVEPCINGRTVALGVYFGLNVDSIVNRLVSEQLVAGTARQRMAPSDLHSRPQSTYWKVFWRTSGLLEDPRNLLLPGVGVRSIFWSEDYFAARAQGKSLIRHGCNSHFRRIGTTTFCAHLITFVR